MRMNMKTQGISETIAMLGAMTKEGRSARMSAIRDTGKMVEKELKKERATGAGWKPLGAISKALGHRKPWGKTKFVTYALKRTIAAIVTTKGRNKKMEEGGNITVSPAFKRFLHTKGIHLKASTTTAAIPGRPLFSRVWDRVNSRILKYFEERFHYNLGRALRRWRVQQ